MDYRIKVVGQSLDQERKIDRLLVPRKWREELKVWDVDVVVIDTRGMVRPTEDKQLSSGEGFYWIDHT